MYSRSSRLNFYSKSPFDSFISNTFVFWPIPNYLNILVKVFHLFWFLINFSWKLGCNCFICRKCILIFNIWMDICTWFINLSIFCSQAPIIKRSVLQYIFLCGRIWYYWDIFSWWRRYSTMNVTTMPGFFAYVWIKWKRGSRFSILEILLMVTIFCGLMKWHMLLVMVILVCASYFMWTPIFFWIIFRIPALLTVYKTTTYICNNIIVKKCLWHEKQQTCVCNKKNSANWRNFVIN